MDSYFKIIKLSLFAVSFIPSAAFAISDGGGRGTYYKGQMIGGDGGNFNHWGGFGGGVEGLPDPALPTQQGNGGNGAEAIPYPDPHYSSGGIANIINTVSDPFGDNQPYPSGGYTWEGKKAVSFGEVVRGGGGGGVRAIINAETYTITLDSVVGGNSGESSVVDGPPESLALLRGSGGGGIAVVFTGQTLNVLDTVWINGGEGYYSPRSDRGVIGGGGMGLLLLNGTLNNAGIIRGGGGAYHPDNLMDEYKSEVDGSQGGTGVYMVSNTTLNNSGEIASGQSFAKGFKAPPSIVMNGNNIKVNNNENGRVFAANFRQFSTGWDPVVQIGGDNNTFVNKGTLYTDDFSLNFYDIETVDMLGIEGNNNTYEMHGGSFNAGRYKSLSGENHLVLAGTIDDSLDLNGVGPAGADLKFTGFADYRKTGSGKWSLTGEQKDSNPWTLEEGTLSLNGVIPGTMHAIKGRLDAVGSVGTLTHEAGAVVSPGGGDIGILTVTGDYIGNDGTLEFATVLGDDSSATSQLVVTGNTSGLASIEVVNKGGLGARTDNGIKLIQVNGQSNAEFFLHGDFQTKNGTSAVVAGAYSYTLHKNGAKTVDGDWYLRSTLRSEEPDPVNPNRDDPDPGNGGGGDKKDPNIPPRDQPRYNPGAPVYENMVQTMQLMNRLPTLQQRVGNRYWNRAGNAVISQGDGPGRTDYVPAPEAGYFVDGNGIWGRIADSYNRFGSRTSVTGDKKIINSSLLQAGVDGVYYDGATGRLIGGITGQYARGQSDSYSDHGDGDLVSQGWGLGGTLTWYGENGFYADGQAQVMWFDTDLNSTTANRRLAEGVEGQGYAASLEVGQRYAINDRWSLTPQGQLMWSTLNMNSFRDVWDANVALDNGNSLMGRLGISADYWNAWHSDSGTLVRTNVYGIANLYQNFLGDQKVRIENTSFSTSGDDTWAGLGLGGTYSWADDKYSIYGEGFVNTSLNHFSDDYAIGGTLGFRVKW